jgi:hypothetical protein
LKKLGYKVFSSYQHPNPGDCLVLWNRMPRHEQYAREYEKCGAQVLIAENAWLGPDEKFEHWFALCLNHHNGCGKWYEGLEKRWPKLGVTLKPWRKHGQHILVLPQRGIGERGVAMPRDWTAKVTRRLRKYTDRPIRVRSHPGKRPHPPLEPDLENCHAVVTWGSGAAIKALVMGIPVIYEMVDWIGGDAATFGISNIEKPYLDDRERMFESLAWAQWTGEEIASGEPFRWLLKTS